MSSTTFEIDGLEIVNQPLALKRGPADRKYRYIELEFEVDYDFNEAEQRTHWEPGCDAYVTVNTISFNGKEIKCPAKWLETLAQEAAELAESYSREDALADKADSANDERGF